MKDHVPPQRIRLFSAPRIVERASWLMSCHFTSHRTTCQVHPRNRPSVEQLLQMPQMLRHSSGLKEDLGRCVLRGVGGSTVGENVVWGTDRLIELFAWRGQDPNQTQAKTRPTPTNTSVVSEVGTGTPRCC